MPRGLERGRGLYIFHPNPVKIRTSRDLFPRAQGLWIEKDASYIGMVRSGTSSSQIHCWSFWISSGAMTAKGDHSSGEPHKTSTAKLERQRWVAYLSQVHNRSLCPPPALDSTTFRASRGCCPEEFHPGMEGSSVHLSQCRIRR